MKKMTLVTRAKFRTEGRGQTAKGTMQGMRAMEKTRANARSEMSTSEMTLVEVADTMTLGAKALSVMEVGVGLLALGKLSSD